MLFGSNRETTSISSEASSSMQMSTYDLARWVLLTGNHILESIILFLTELAVREMRSLKAEFPLDCYYILAIYLISFKTVNENEGHTGGHQNISMSYINNC